MYMQPREVKILLDYITKTIVQLLWLLSKLNTFMKTLICYWKLTSFTVCVY